MIDLEVPITISRAGKDIELIVGATALPFTQSLELEADGGVESIEYVLDSFGQPWYGDLTPDEQNQAHDVLKAYLEEASEPNLEWDGE